ncbi:3-oxoacyl-[acyl-carrier-protein] reductase [Dehalococcoidia bacterium]|nr:3-oxoacyl-[acyl-carrier-protein] reductase [Dehalococcoidia bacterium]
MLQTGSLKGKVALVTGASRGIGLGIARRLGMSGARIVINDVIFRDGQDTLVKTFMELGSEASTYQADVTNATQVDQMFQDISKKLGGVDILVNNAGITRDSLLLRMSEEQWDSVLAINLKGAFLCSRAAIRAMMRKKWGRIVNLASVVALAGNPGQANYAASKAGLIGLTRTVAREVASRNITVNALAPGFIATDMVDALSDDMKSKVKERIPMDRFGTAEDVAAVVAFLSGEEASYITGQVIGIDGGLIL